MDRPFNITPNQITLENTLRPFKDMLDDIRWTFGHYHDDTRYTYRNRRENAGNDIAQPVRGLFNVGKGLLRLIIGLTVVALSPILLLLICVRMQIKNRPVYCENKPSNYPPNTTAKEPSIFFDKFKKLGKNVLYEILYYLINGLGMVLRGALQIATTPLTWVLRIPLRLTITALEKNGGKVNLNDNVNVAQYTTNEFVPKQVERSPASSSSNNNQCQSTPAVPYDNVHPSMWIDHKGIFHTPRYPQKLSSGFEQKNLHN